MNAFWKWLMRTNARAVFLASVLALLAVIAFWAWMLSTPLEDITMLPASARNKPDSGNGLAVLAYVESLSGLSNAVPVRNPFLVDADRDRHTREPVQTIKVAVEPTVVMNTTGGTAPVKPAVIQGPVRRSVSLTYRGIYKRSDGRAMVLMEDSNSKASFFYEVDGAVFGMKIGMVGEEKIELVPDGAQAVTMQRGESVVFNGIKDGR